jgi:hypothetical protein
MTERKIAYYRLLNVGEIIPEGAEFRDSWTNGWRGSICVGGINDSKDPELYRVPVYEDELAPKETRVIVSLDADTRKFLESMSHDIRSPIRNMSEYMRETKSFIFRIVEMLERR